MQEVEKSFGHLFIEGNPLNFDHSLYTALPIEDNIQYNYIVWEYNIVLY